ncbi:MAG: hypothetical protein KC609_15365, partial [Myxococcales bacterium]|nr:hypothetical protein [Myxococcales bacterium]
DCVDAGAPKCLCQNPAGCTGCGPLNLTCVIGEQCIDGQCRCSSDSFCPPGFVCESGLCRCQNPAGCDCRGALCFAGELCDTANASCHCGNKLSDAACNRDDNDTCSDPAGHTCICSGFQAKCPKDYNCVAGKCRCTKNNCSCGKGNGCGLNVACTPNDTCEP